MPYKIVKTSERGQPRLSIVPSAWEENGVLRWPKKATNINKLIQDEKSRPRWDWTSMSCDLKRSGIRSYKEADDELSIMERNTDTEVDEAGGNVDMGLTRQVIDFDELAENLLYSQQKSNTSNTANDTLNTSEGTVLQITSENINLDQVLANQSTILENISCLFDTMNTVLGNQQKIAHKIASLSVQLDEVSAKLTEQREQPVQVTLLKDSKKTEECYSFSFNAIENLEGLESLEELLSSKTEADKLKRRLSFLCSSEVGKGQTCAYRLLDVMFTRNFLCDCSWAGGSRGEHPKIGIMKYKRVLKFFSEMVNTWDCSFTMQDTDRFFRVILKNSTRRSTVKGIRTAAKRVRIQSESSDKRIKMTKAREDENKSDDRHGETTLDNDEESLC